MMAKSMLAWLVAFVLALVAGPQDAFAAAGTQGAASPDAPGAQTRRFALVIGSNNTLSKKQAPLRFADDDAARVAELLTELGFDVELLTTLDRDTQAVFAELVGRATRPTRSNVHRVHRKLVRRMAAAKRAGPVELVIYYSGHGDVGPDGKGYLTLDDGKLTRDDVFGRLIAKSPADHNHLIVDACQSEEFVLSRGRDWKPDRSSVDYSRSVQSYLDRKHLGSYPNTGVVLASSADQQTHEWQRYRGGVFTHELVSGLRGGADLNGDGHIEYSEVGAFVSAANSGVADPRARLQVVVRPPKDDERTPLLSHERIAQQRVLLFGASGQGRYVVEDRRGVRLADVNLSGDRPAYLRLPEGDLFVYREVEVAGSVRFHETGIAAARGGVISTRDLRFAPTQRASRGALDEAFRVGLFAVPYGSGYYRGYTDMHGLLAVKEPKWQVRVWKEVDGELVEVSTTTVETAPKEEGVPEPPPAPPEPCPPCEDDDDDDDRHHRGPREIWGSLSVGTVFSPFNPGGRIELFPRRVIANQFVPRIGKSDSGPLRGFDVRWNVFWVRGHKRPYPRYQLYFRTGYTQGRANFLPRPEEMDFLDGEPTSLDYLTVPLFFGNSIYVFDEFPVRPYAGLGFGFDILRVDYSRTASDDLVDVSARIGFELHAGVEVRITNYFSLFGEVMQLWSARRKLDTVPDYSNEGFTIVTGLSAGIPMHRKNEQRRAKYERKRKKRAAAERRRAQERKAKAERERKQAPKPGAVRVQVKEGDDTLVIEAAKPGAEQGKAEGEPEPNVEPDAAEEPAAEAEDDKSGDPSPEPTTQPDAPPP